MVNYRNFPKGSVDKAGFLIENLLGRRFCPIFSIGERLVAPRVEDIRESMLDYLCQPYSRKRPDFGVLSAGMREVYPAVSGRTALRPDHIPKQPGLG